MLVHECVGGSDKHAIEVNVYNGVRGAPTPQIVVSDMDIRSRAERQGCTVGKAALCNLHEEMGEDRVFRLSDLLSDAKNFNLIEQGRTPGKLVEQLNGHH